MCLILFSWQQSAAHPLILAANRDERYDRPTRGLHNWQQPHGIIGGRDLQAGGSWLAANQQGRFAAVTNVRDPRLVSDDARSRGSLITDYLTSDLSSDEWLGELRERRDDYAGFNLLVGDLRLSQLTCYSNLTDQLDKLSPGTYGLSNGSLDEPWPKVERGKRLLTESLSTTSEPDITDLFTLLADDYQPHETLLPNTGVGTDLERLLAPITIHSELYGTCSSSVFLAHANGKLQLHEQDRRPETIATLLSESWMAIAD
ncbi:MAG: hypothetical protein DRQ60_10010 [Gammaproteobacteria bacterium]|nr:MAG: hypothetical protein DRQ54_08630 [Gammaproteobacteria bacterium]RLA11367.1 MAG: hypothetical protein DRQ60_10010 [Gammaproteobacteria bacterium]